MLNNRATEDYQRIASAITFLDDHVREQPTLDEVAEAVGLSPYHFHRLFRRWAGTTPKRFLQLLTLGDAKRRLEASRSVLHTAFDVGLSGPGRLHDLFVTLEGVTPGEYAGGGDGVELIHGLAGTPFGRAHIGRTQRGVCHLAFIDGTPDEAMAELAERWPGARMTRDDAAARSVADAIFAGDRPPLHVKGTNFQVRVWEALLRIPEGHVASYGDVAGGLGRPRAVRAVAGAVARNRVAYLIPCHRVIRKVGEAGGYRWGPDRKRAMLAWESARAS